MSKESSLICCFGISYLFSVVAYENLSRRNTTILTQSSTYDQNLATLANDGILKTTFNFCGYTQPGHPTAWLQVDLGKSFSIKSVKIYYRNEGNKLNDWKQYRFRQFYLDVSDLPVTQTTTAQRTRCYTDNTTAPNLPPNIIDIPCKQTARYIIVETIYDATEDKYSGAMLEICEIEVYGCSTDSFGNNCSSCPDCNMCDIDNGTCLCDINHYGSTCSQVCSSYCKDGCDLDKGTCNSCIDERFMEFCTETCGDGCFSGCDQYSGNCTCKPGWKGDRCTECDGKRYGPNCSLKCSPYCQDGCDIKTGICDSCIEGRFSESCTEACGDGCVSGCDRYRGNCTCKPGWREGRCDVCDLKHYGLNCSLECSTYCKDGCAHDADSCTHCIDGRFSESCTEICAAGCVSGCDRYRGNCTCKPGWAGSRCDECDTMHHGPNCTLECSPYCQDGCNLDTGVCNSCIDGRFTESCSEVCGEWCVSGCERYSGNCTCKPGWKGRLCDECDATHYGPNCSLECSPFCKDGCVLDTGTCNSCIDGRFSESCSQTCAAGCVSGCDRYRGNCTCKPWWTGGLCDVQRFESANNLSSNYPLYTLAVLLSISLLVILFLVNRMFKRKTSTSQTYLSPTYGEKVDDSEYISALPTSIYSVYNSVVEDNSYQELGQLRRSHVPYEQLEQVTVEEANN